MLASYAKNYRRLWEEHWWWRARRRFVLRRLDALSARRPLAKILDIGCGDGLFFDELSRYGEPWGVEAYAERLDPKGKWTPRIRREAFGPGYRDERGYDLVLMLDSLEHIEDDAAAVRRAAELLKPGGFLFLTVPALPSLWSVHDEASLHFRRYTRTALRAVLENAGLRVEELGSLFGWAALPMYARKLLGGGRGRADAAAEYDIAIPPGPLNAALYGASVAEQSLFGSRGAPFGSSLFAAARRPEAS